jgi:hypothetical protein
MSTEWFNMPNSCPLPFTGEGWVRVFFLLPSLRRNRRKKTLTFPQAGERINAISKQPDI